LKRLLLKSSQVDATHVRKCQFCNRVSVGQGKRFLVLTCAWAWGALFQGWSLFYLVETSVFDSVIRQWFSKASNLYFHSELKRHILNQKKVGPSSSRLGTCQGKILLPWPNKLSCKPAFANVCGLPLHFVM
jgi:hypothetical protein